MDAAEDGLDRRPGDAASHPGDRGLHRVAHDINGALNTLALNIELLDRATASGSSADDETRAAARDRSLAALRRAVVEIQQIVTLRLAPGATGTAAAKETL